MSLDNLSYLDQLEIDCITYDESAPGFAEDPEVAFADFVAAGRRIIPDFDNKLATVVKCAPSTIERWSKRSTCPHVNVRKFVINAIGELAAEAEAARKAKSSNLCP